MDRTRPTACANSYCQQESNGVRATRNAVAKTRIGGVEPEEEAKARRSLRPRKGVSYATNVDDSEYELSSQSEAGSARDADEEDEMQVKFQSSISVASSYSPSATSASQ